MAKKKDIELGTSKEDYIASASRALVNAVPGGSFLGELITFAIPNQRMDRFAEVLKKVMQEVEDLEERLNSPENRDLFEEAGIQSGRAVTDERRLYIANMLKNGLKNSDNSYFEKKKLFSILENLNEVEIILLKQTSLISGQGKFIGNENKDFGVISGMDKYFALMDYKSKNDTFYQKHSEILNNWNYKDSDAFYSSYMSTLERNNLIKSEEGVGITGRPMYTVTPLGELFLSYIEVPEN